MQALDVQPGDRILEIGTGSGYLTACLAKLGAHVTSLDTQAEFTQQAAGRLATHGIENVDLKTEDGLAAPQASGPFDIIAVTGSVPELPDMLKRQLTVGGRMFVILASSARDTSPLRRMRSRIRRRLTSRLSCGFPVSVSAMETILIK